MAGYSRQSAASIVPTAVVRATPLNDEFNALRDAFVVATGHKHDGTSTEGAYIPLVSDTNARNKVVVDSTNNRISLFINVSSAAVEQLRLIDGAILPVTDNDIDLGSSTFEFKDLFIDGTANIDSLVADTAAISGGTINSTVIGGTTPAAGTFTTVSATVSATIPSATISGGTINNTTIGATTPAAGTFTNLTVNTAATIASAAISAGTINNTVIGGTTPQAVTGTTITANTGFVGALTGNVTGNVTASSGTSTFNNATVNGTLSATLTGNVNASSGTSTFNNVTISGTLNMDGATAATITNLSSPVNNSDAATKLYVDTSISNLVNSAPGTLDTLNELAAALGNDPSFATTVTNSIATKLSLSGGTMTGAIAMGTNKITGMGDPTSAQDAATKTYVDTQRDTRLALSGGTMSGAIAMGTNKITGLGDPTSNQDAATKIYVDGILGSATSAAASAAAAATSASNAATSASNASTSATNAASSASAAAASAAAAAASYDSFDDRYLGVKTSDPSLDNDGNALVTGAIYFNSSAGEMRVWTGSAWASTLLTTGAQTFTGVKTFASNPILDAGTANGVAYLNGSKVLTTGSALSFNGSDLTVANGDLTIATNGKKLYVNYIANNSGADLNINGAVNSIFAIASAEQMRLTSTGLGIGTSSPATKLDVAGSALIGVYTVGGMGAQTGLTVIGGATVSSNDPGILTLGSHLNARTTGDVLGKIDFYSNDASGGASGVQASIRGITETSIGDAAGLAFYTGTSSSMPERMRLDSSGNLGIGTSSPSAKLHVVGNQFRQNDATNSQGYTINTTSATTTLVTLFGGSSFAIQTGGSGTNQLLLDSSGNLGLGVTPSASWANYKVLQIGEQGVISGFASGAGVLNTGANFYWDGSVYRYLTTNPASLYQQNAGAHNWRIAGSGTAGNAISFTQAMTLDASSRLLVGTTTAKADVLTVQNSGLVSNTAWFKGTGGGLTYIAVGNDADKAVAVGIYASTYSGGSNFGIGASGGYISTSNGAPFAVGTGDSQPFILGTGNSERARITSTGTFQLTNNYQEGVLTANTGTAYTIDLVNGTLQILTLTGNCTFTFPTATAGQSFTMLLRQDGTGGRTVTWPAAVRWPGNTAPTITSTASQTDKYIFTADGTRWYGSNAGQAYVA